MNPVEIIRFNEKLLARAYKNLDAARLNGDTIAANNIRRKIGIYKTTIEIVKYYIDETKEIGEKIEGVADRESGN